MNLLFKILRKSFFNTKTCVKEIILSSEIVDHSMSFFYFVTVTQESQMVFGVMLTGLAVLVHSHLYAWTLVNWTIIIFWMNGCAFWWVLEAQKVSAYPDFTQSLRIKWIPLRIVTKINKKQRDFEFDNNTKCCLWGTPVQLVPHFSCRCLK